ncbi:MAG: hypothetical protein AAF628_30415, partial [Planctomycetota bacterium]
MSNVLSIAPRSSRRVALAVLIVTVGVAAWGGVPRAGAPAAPVGPRTLHETGDVARPAAAAGA